MYSRTSDDQSTVSRIIQLFHIMVIEKPEIYLWEIQEELQHTLLLEADISTICRFLHASGFTHKKLHLIALQRDEFTRQQFKIGVSL